MSHALLILAAAPATSQSLLGLAFLLAMASAALLAGCLAWKAGRETGQAEGRESGQALGHDEGYGEGRCDGFAEGRDDGYLSGKLEGVNAGYRDGHADGKRIGRYEALLQIQGRVEALIHPDEVAS